MRGIFIPACNSQDEVIHLNLSKYARIGKAPFIKAIGVQKNHKEKIYTESQELDHAASGCFACENYKNIEFYDYMPEEVRSRAKKCCENCPCAVYRTVIHESYKYINETNIFGNKPRIKAIALKLLLVYHFLSPDDHGVVAGLSSKELAEYLGCTVRSIKNANSTLQKYEYIMYSQDGARKNRFQVILTEYSSYSLPADQGGRGYATFNLECLQELIQIKDLNQLRILLRAALDADTNRNPDKELIISQDYESLRRFLPDYCKPGIIRRALSSVTALFSVVFDDEHIFLKMDSAFHGRRMFDSSNENHASQIKEYIDRLDGAMKRANQQIIRNESPDQDDIALLTREGICSKYKFPSHKELFVSFNLEKNDFKDLGILCTTFSFEDVKKCIGYIYENYQIDFKIDCIGALVRTLLKEKAQTQELSLLFFNT